MFLFSYFLEVLCSVQCGKRLGHDITWPYRHIMLCTYAVILCVRIQCPSFSLIARDHAMNFRFLFTSFCSTSLAAILMTSAAISASFASPVAGKTYGTSNQSKAHVTLPASAPCHL